MEQGNEGQGEFDEVNTIMTQSCNENISESH